MATLFYEPFEDSSNWVGSNLKILSDPLKQFNNVATFSSTSVLPTVFSTVIYNVGKSYTITFDYLGLPLNIATSVNLGGLIGISDGGNMADRTITYAGSIKNNNPPLTSCWGNVITGWTVADGCGSAGCSITCDTYSYKTDSLMFLTDNKLWGHYSLSFTSSSNNIRLALGDYAWANYPESGLAGDSYFTNILVTDSHGPSPFIATSVPENFRSISVDVLNQIANTVSYVNSNAAININLATNSASGGYASGDSLNNIVNIIGSSFGDIILGSSADNTLSGGDGDDVLTAETGNDILIGGNGVDKFVISSLITKATIQDFDISRDVIDLRLFPNLNSLQDIKNASQYLNGNTVIDLGSTKTLILSGISYDDLLENNFIIITLAPTKVPTFAPINAPTLVPTTLIPSAVPTILPTSPTPEPTTSTPSLAPTVKPSSEPTILPTVIPTLNPTLSPSNTPTIMPTTAPSIGPSTSPTALPTDIPTVTPTLSPTIMPTALYSTIVDISTGGSYVGSSASENFIIDSPLAVIVAGGLGIDKFTIAPNPEVIYTIADFDFMHERIDLNRCNIHSKSDLGIATSGDFTLITLKNNNQQLKLLNVGSQDLAYGNFIFTSETNNKDSSSGLSQEAIIGIALGGSAFIGIGICALAYVNYISEFPAYNAVHAAKVIGDTGLEIVA